MIVAAMLEGAGLVTRRASDADGRGRVVALTDAGRELIDDGFAAHIENEHRLVDQLSAEDSRALEGILTRWIGVYEGH